MAHGRSKAMEKNGIDYGVAPMPKLPNGQPMKTFVGVKGWHVTSFSKQNDLATKFTEWVTNEENAKIRFEKTKEIPPVKSVMEDQLLKITKLQKQLQRNLKMEFQCQTFQKCKKFGNQLEMRFN